MELQLPSCPGDTKASNAVNTKVVGGWVMRRERLEYASIHQLGVYSNDWIKMQTKRTIFFLLKRYSYSLLGEKLI